MLSIITPYVNLLKGDFLNKRLPWIDYAKAIAVMLVLNRHIMLGLIRSGLEIPQFIITANNMVYSFRMPMFFILSGLFLRRTVIKKSNSEFLSIKFSTILYPCLAWSIIQLTIQLVFNEYVNAERTWSNYFHIFIKINSFDQFWFLYTMFGTSLLYLLTYKIGKGNKIWLLAIGIVSFIISAYIEDISYLRNNIYNILYFFMFVTIGDAFGQFILDQKYFRYYSS